MRRRLSMIRSLTFAAATILCLTMVIPAAAQTVERHEEGWLFENSFDFPIEAVGDLAFEDFGGHITVTSDNLPSVRIHQSIPLVRGLEAEALAYGKEFAPVLRKQGDSVVIEGSGVPRGSSYEIIIPSSMGFTLESDGGVTQVFSIGGSVDINSSGGSIELEDIEGDVYLRSDGGYISANGVGGSFSVTSGGGNIDVASVDGDLVVSSGGGSLDVSDIEGEVDLLTAGGNIGVMGVKTDVSAVTSGGNIELSDVGGNADLTSGGGDIEVENVRGDLDATTSGGDIEVDNVEGSMRLETLAGDIEITGVQGNVRVISEVGNVEIEVADAHFLESGRMSVNLQHGDIWLLLPADTNANVIANVQEEGTIEIDQEGWEVEVLGQRSPSSGRGTRRAEIQIGKGGGPIELTLQGGEVIIENR